VQGGIKDALTITVLHYRALVHYSDGVCLIADGCKVVRDEQITHTEAPLGIRQQVYDLQPHGHVEG